MRIWKYPLEVTDLQTVEMPHGAKILTVQMQGTTCCLWALVEDEMPRHLNQSRRIAIYGTGNPVPRNLRQDYIATFQMEGGALVFHAFEVQA